MAITVEAVYEGGVLKPVEPLTSLREGQKVKVIVADPRASATRAAGVIDWQGRHEEFRAFLNDPDELYGTPDDWFGRSEQKDEP